MARQLLLHMVPLSSSCKAVVYAELHAPSYNVCLQSSLLCTCCSITRLMECCAHAGNVRPPLPTKLVVRHSADGMCHILHVSVQHMQRLQLTAVLCKNTIHSCYIRELVQCC